MIKLGLFFFIIAALALSVSCQFESLPLNEVMTGTFTKQDPTTTWVIHALVDHNTHKTFPYSVSLFPLMGSKSPNEHTPPQLALTAGFDPEVNHQSAGAIATAETPYQSIIVPPQDSTDPLANDVTIYVTAEGLTFNSSVTYYISCSLVSNALDPANILSQKEGTYKVRQRVNAGQRLFFYYEPTVTSKIFIEECSYTDVTNQNNPLSAAFLFNTTTDEMPEYNQEYVDFPCGNDVGGNIVVTDPHNDKDSRYLKVCPSFVTFTEAQPTGTFFAVDVLRFWQEPLSLGYLDWSITIYTNTFVDFPLEHSSGDPDFVEIAPIEADTDSQPNLTLSFAPWKFSNGTIISTALYGVFTDMREDELTRQNLIASNSLTSGCFLLENSHTMLWRSQFHVNELTIVDDDTVELVLKDFYTDLPAQTTPFHLTIVASTQNLGEFAYTYVTFTPDGEVYDSGLEGWAIFLIILAVFLVVALAIVLIAGLAFFGYRAKQRTSYDTMG